MGVIVPFVREMAVGYKKRPKINGLRSGETVLGSGGAWLHRIHGICANASRRSHAELDDGNAEEFGAQYRAPNALLPRMNVVAGCCAADHRHVGAIGNPLKGARGSEPRKALPIRRYTRAIHVIDKCAARTATMLPN
ncbi:hypothetical protein AWB79_04454 [Caballeronia hypogeia]|uniref:Uncharacterized protein n=1 Tax=Caballeronia hypogeia TaxID=1777140 RepID=A0A158BZ69_9BURK|nr:hypothetical protein [Caballeronia hypogeia]SAK75405.1 hypothetical protein AWB79_04454 [Caballeronia hypogeia]